MASCHKITVITLEFIIIVNLNTFIISIIITIIIIGTSHIFTIVIVITKIPLRIALLLAYITMFSYFYIHFIL